MKEDEERSGLEALAGQAIGVAGAIAAAEAVGLQLAEVGARLRDAVALGCQAVGGEDGGMDLCGAPAAELYYYRDTHPSRRIPTLGARAEWVSWVDEGSGLFRACSPTGNAITVARGGVAFPFAVCQTAPMVADHGNEYEEIDETLLDCFLDLGLKARIQSAANFANAVQTLRRIRSPHDSEQPA